MDCLSFLQLQVNINYLLELNVELIYKLSEPALNILDSVI